MEMIFYQIDDPITAQTFALVNKKWNKWFEKKRNEMFPRERWPLPITTQLVLDVRELSLRVNLRDLFFETHFWNPVKEIFIPLEYIDWDFDLIIEDIDSYRNGVMTARRAEYDEEIRRKCHDKHLDAMEELAREREEDDDDVDGDSNGSVNESLVQTYLDYNSDFDDSPYRDEVEKENPPFVSDFDPVKKPNWKAMSMKEPKEKEWIEISIRDKEILRAKKSQKGPGRPRTRPRAPSMTESEINAPPQSILSEYQA